MSTPSPCQSESSPLAASFFAPESVRRGTPRASKSGRKRAWVLLLVHLLVFAHILHWKLRGKTLSPLEPSEAMFTIVEGALNAGFILFLLSIASTLVLGRYFCGWACHVVALQDGSAWLLKKLGIRPRPLKSKALRWIPLLAGIYLFIWPWFWNTFIYNRPRPAGSIELVTSDFWKTFPGPWISILTFFVCGFGMVYLLGAKGFCTYACPYGGIFGVVDRFSPGRILVTDACKGCGHCTAVCTSNVEVHREVREFGMVVDPGCMKCRDCVSVCPEGALYFGFAKPAVFAKAKRKSGHVNKAMFSRAEEVGLVAGFSAALFALRGFPDHLVAGTSRLFVGEEIPLLLAWGLAAIAAFAGVYAARLLRSKEVTFLGASMRAEHRLTRRGRWLLAGTLAVGLGVGFAGLLQAWSLSAESAWKYTLPPAAPTAPTPDALKAAESRVARIQRFRPQDPILLFRLANLRGRQGRIAEALGPMIEAASKASPASRHEYLEHLRSLAVAAFGGGDSKSAASALEAVRVYQPGDPVLVCALAEAWSAQGDTKKARALLESFLTANPDAPGVRETLAQLPQ
jgi:ferredoxin-type protein NapH